MMHEHKYFKQMKKSVLLFASFLVSIALFAQTGQATRTLTWDGLERQYIEYTPASYTGDEAVPVVFGLHGLGDNMNNFYSAIGMNLIADTAGFILIVPEAVEFSMYGYTATAWNSGASYMGITPNEDVDDTGFIMAVLDSLETHYNVDAEKVYAFGFSIGGYMCNRLACEHGERLNSIASVSATIGVGFTPETTTPVSVLQFHGTADETVAYENNDSGMDVIEYINFWKDINNTDTDSIYYQYPNVADDGLLFKRFIYPNGDAALAHIKVIGGEHNWYYTPSYDISYENEIWRFFRNKFDVTTGCKNLVTQKEFTAYPNPFKENVTIHTTQPAGKIQCYDMTGKSVFSKSIESTSTTLHLGRLNSGLYILEYSDGTTSTCKRIVKE